MRNLFNEIWMFAVKKLYIWIHLYLTSLQPVHVHGCFVSIFYMFMNTKMIKLINREIEINSKTLTLFVGTAKH